MFDLGFLGPLGPLVSQGAELYLGKQAAKQKAKQAMIDFQLQKKQLELEIAKQNALAEQQRVAGASAAAKPRGAGGGGKQKSTFGGDLPSWAVPVGVAAVAAFFLLRR